MEVGSEDKRWKLTAVFILGMDVKAYAEDALMAPPA